MATHKLAAMSLQVLLSVVLLIITLVTSAISSPSPSSSASSVGYPSENAPCEALSPWMDAFGAPTCNLTLFFRGTRVLEGQLLPLNHTQERPRVRLDLPQAHFPKGGFTLLMVDPDAHCPSYPDIRNYLHWIVANISLGVKDKDDEVVTYQPPNPPCGTHRYYILILKQNEDVYLKAPKNRTNFSVREYAKEYQLQYPLCGACFRVSAPTNTSHA